MGKLCESIAVVGELEGAWKKILEESKVTFGKKHEHFVAFVKRYSPFAEEEKATENIEERKDLDTTVNDKLDYMFEHVINYLDCFAQVEATNQVAKADLEVDGKVILSGVPATVLLGLESKLRAVKEVLDLLPTLAPGISWVKDATRGPNIYKRERDEESFRTRKEPKSKTLYDATKEHPAQIEKWTEMINIGKYITTHWSGMLSPAEKSDMLGRLDKLSRAVKQARQRANVQEVVDIHIGQKLVTYIMKGE